MLKDPRNLLWLVPLAALLTLPLWKPLAADFLSPRHRKASSAAPSLATSRVLSSSDMTGVEFEQSRNGFREWLLTASRLNSSEGNPDLQLEDVQASFFKAGRKKERTRIKSQRARYNTDTRELALEGKVVIVNDAGYKMQTNALEYHAADKKIRSTSKVNIQGSNISVSGNRLVYDTSTGNYSLAGNVICRIW